MSQRNHLIDFWRGVALMMIFINHVPGNLLEKLTSRNVGFSDGAEAFVFIAGLSVALIFLREPKAGETRVTILSLTARCWKRALELYRIHVVLSFGVLALFALAYAVFQEPVFRNGAGRAFVFDQPESGFLAIALLAHQFDYIDILPLYVVLMAMAPLMLALLRRNVVAGLALSIAIYLGARLTHLDMPTWLENRAWFFNPFAWQLIFTLGAAAGLVWRGKSLPRSGWLIYPSAAIVALGAVIVSDAFGLAPGLQLALRDYLDTGKHNLGLTRLVHFLALAYLLAALPWGAWLSSTKIGQEFVLWGRNALPVFVLGTVLSELCQLTMAASAVTFDINPQPVGLAATLAGLTVLSTQARYIEWQKRHPGSGLLSLVRAALPALGWPSSWLPAPSRFRP
ncbi:MAG: OpgC domain-containing protein [Beijerinckiaceae bacterium]|nr:OpgC domain-containing protein [Beijerinckiaceae bacterium]MDO9439286.1 OpgC domain-containing protein [Beijerinckiaceae bacterium]